jgi:CHAT domain-containing protein
MARITGRDISTQSASRGIQAEKTLQAVDYSALESSDLMSRSAADVGLNRNGQGLPRLLFSRKEAEAILAVTPRDQGKEWLDFSANRAAATDPSLAQYRMIHFATHGLLNSEHPELSGLVLSLVDHNGQPQNGFLQLQDIYNLNLHADLVVLSACETALGKDISGEGLIGLTRGFMYAGANRVVASLWKVSDVATAQLMAEFYRAMEKDGMTPAAALRAAQIKMWQQKRWHDPYYWAAFQIQGEWK